MGRALVRHPKIFLFDEPLSNLDAKLRVEMRTEIKKLHQRLKATIVYVTHDQIEAMTLATRIAVMKAGELLAARHAQGDLREPGRPVRRRLHGLAVDEPDPGQAGRGQWRPRGRDDARRGRAGQLPLANGNAAWRGLCRPRRDPGPAAGADQRPHQHRGARARPRTAGLPGRGHRAHRPGHAGGDDAGRRRGHRPPARRHQGAARRGLHLHGRHEQGLPVRPQERAPDRRDARGRPTSW